MQIKLHSFLLRYRITPHTTTGRSPAELLNGRKLKTRLDLLHPALQGRVKQNQSNMKKYHDGKTPLRLLLPGDDVSAKHFAAGSKWLNGKDVKATGPLLYEVELTDGRITRRHVDHLLKRKTVAEKKAEKLEAVSASVPTESRLPLTDWEAEKHINVPAPVDGVECPPTPTLVPEVNIQESATADTSTEMKATRSSQVAASPSTKTTSIRSRYPTRDRRTISSHKVVVFFCCSILNHFLYQF